MTDATHDPPRHRLDEAELEGLADVVLDCVADGASFGFMDGLTRERAVAFWRDGRRRRGARRPRAAGRGGRARHLRHGAAPLRASPTTSRTAATSRRCSSTAAPAAAAWARR